MPVLRPSFFDARENIRHDLRLRIRALRTAVMSPRTHTAPASRSRPPLTSRSRRREEAGNFFCCSALEIFALNGLAPKSAFPRTLFARSSATMGRAWLISASSALCVMTRTWFCARALQNPITCPTSCGLAPPTVFANPPVTSNDPRSRRFFPRSPALSGRPLRVAC